MNYESAQQAANRLGITICTIRKRAKGDRIPEAPRHGRSWMIPADSVPKGQGEAQPKYVELQFTNDCAARLPRRRYDREIAESTGY